ncbi:mitochondrial assembly of ribosomal large subunit protein 1 [Rhineura floridana]|uniref:mitochondrial assembly of ribosomal large subunit protein 1 n=1 Tax=Rhineura floridana TaxID=261503 RepID=UPI002AC80F4C|nr:mitochondrial assembly of ribosomal large subunit protein 1 [Rhineura floridana]
MWRAGRCLGALLELRSFETAGSSSRMRRLREVVIPAAAAAPSVLSCMRSLGLRRVGSCEVRDAEEGAGMEQESQGDDRVGQQEQRIRPDTGGAADQSGHVSSVFSIDNMVSLLRQESAKDICVIELPPEMKYSNYFIIVSGSSSRHLHAMAQYVVKMYKYLKTDSDSHVIIEGKDTDDWLCIDFGNIVVHFMLPETREIYELEKLWTLRSYDDQLAQIVPESLPDDFIFGLTSEEQ